MQNCFLPQFACHQKNKTTMVTTVSFISFALLNFFTRDSEAYRVCVIGGGISGLTISTLLQDKGYDVELYEATTKFGGKLNTYRGNNAVLERGPIIFTKNEPYTNKWLQKFEIKTMEYDVNDHAVLLPTNGKVIPSVPLSVYRDRVCDLTTIYKQEWNKYPASTWEFGYSSADFSTYPELAEGIDSWLNDRGLSELSPYFLWYITIEGYGDLRLTPALYALKLISADDAEFFFELGWKAQTVQKGFDEFACKIANRIRKKYLGWEATKIQRRSDGTHIVSFKVNSRVVTKTCTETILAFPPLYKNLQNILNPLPTQEWKIFQAVQVKHFASSGLDIPSKELTHTVYIILQPKPYNGSGVPQFEFPEGDGSLLALTRQTKGGVSSHYTGYSWLYGDYDEKAGPSELDVMKEKLDYLLRQVDPSYSLYFLNATDYFPHVPKEAIMQGFYKDLEGIQGRQGVYFATTLLTFETMNNAIEMSENFVKRYY